jgi:dTDP-4-dehydrorhamnose reductase
VDAIEKIQIFNGAEGSVWPGGSSPAPAECWARSWCVGCGVPPGVYHATSAGQAAWYGLAREIFALLGADPARIARSRTGGRRCGARSRNR